jgi:cystathionine beta-lyase/cystathionine gamma-synthase
MRAHNANSLALAQHLASRSDIRVVHHAGLEEHPDHERALRLFDGLGGILSFELDRDSDGIEACLARLELVTKATSLGGVESLVCRPVKTSYSGITEAERERTCINDRLLRVSVGVEAIEDIIADIDQALDG